MRDSSWKNLKKRANNEKKLKRAVKIIRRNDGECHDHFGYYEHCYAYRYRNIKLTKYHSIDMVITDELTYEYGMYIETKKRYNDLASAWNWRYHYRYKGYGNVMNRWNRKNISHLYDLYNEIIVNNIQLPTSKYRRNKYRASKAYSWW